ncbi:BNR repeat [Sphingobacterium sp. JB170]|nr:BNR repeat [Sphingobacterium sp. JB170]
MKNKMKIINHIYCLTYTAVLLLTSCSDSEVKNSVHESPAEFMTIPNVTLPNLRAVGEKLYMSWVDTVSNKREAQLKIAEISDNVLQPPLTLASSDEWFVNWADYPTIAVNGDYILAHFLQNVEADHRMAYDIKFGVHDMTKPVRTFERLNTDETATEHGFVSMLALTDTSFFITWLDGRMMQSGQDHSHNHNHHGRHGMNVRAAEINLKGQISNEIVLDQMACTCCQTTAALTASGPVVLYRDCTIDNIRDIVITRKIGEQWTEPRPIHLDGWKINGCPVNGPKVDAYQDDLAVAWFTGANGEPKVNVSFSADAGATFSEPISVSQGVPIGRVDLVLLNAEQALVSWMASTGTETFLYAQKIGTDGMKGRPVKIDTVSADRKTGFPQMEVVNDRVYFAWTIPKGTASDVKITHMAVDQF